MADSNRLAELEQKFADNPRRYFAPLANELRKAGDLGRAIDICRAQLAEQPSHMSGHVVLAQALYDAGETAESRTVFERAIELDPENLIALRQLGDLAAEQGDTREATRWYERALDLDPRDEGIVAALAALSTEPRSYAAAPVGSAPEPAADVPATEEPDPGATEDDGAVADSDDWLLDRAEPGETVESSAATSIFEEQGYEVVDAEAAGIVVPSPFVTETMAELYAQQGFTSEALDIYRRLAAMRDDPALRARADELEGQLLARAPSGEPIADEPVASAESPAEDMEAAEPLAEEIADASSDEGAAVQAAAGPSVREFFARLGARKWEARGATPPSPAGDNESDAARRAVPGSLATIFGAEAAPDDSLAARRLSGAFPSGSA